MSLGNVQLLNVLKRKCARKIMRITEQLLRNRSRKPLDQVQYLDLSKTNIVTLNKLELCPKLTTLTASYNCLESVPNLDCCPELWKLDLSHNKLQSINGLCRFPVLGCLVLSNNCLDWSDLENLHHIHILELSLHGNSKLEKDPYYRMHVIDSLPLVWMLDGRLITSAERQQVQKFFSERELTERPVRHKVSCRKRFTPTPLQNLSVTGVFGEKTEHWMKRFPLHEKLTQELDRRRLQYLAFNLQEEFRLQSLCSNNNESKEAGEMFVAVIDGRESEREKSNMLLLLLVAMLEFHIPEQVLQQTLDIAKLTKIGSHETKNIFLLPKKEQCSVASLLLAGVKIDRDAKLDDGLYDCLYLCLYDLVSEWHKLVNNHNVHRKNGIRDILAAEVVQLFCIVPAFLMLLGKDTGLLELVSSATKERDIAEQLYSLVVKEKSKGTESGEMLRLMASYIIKKVNKKCCQFVDKPASNKQPEKSNPPLRTSSYTKSLNTRNQLPRHSQSASSIVRQNIPKTKHDITGKKIGKSRNVRSLGRSPALGDQVITSDEVCGHIAAIPEKNIVLIKLDNIPGHGLQQSNLKKKSCGNGGRRFIYFSKDLLVWHCPGYWKVHEAVKGNEEQFQTSKNEKNSPEAYLANTIKKQLPVEVWMSFSTLQHASNKFENITSESSSPAITQHIRELVKECIEEAKITNEIQPEEKKKDIELNRPTLMRMNVKDRSHLNEFESVKEQKDVSGEELKEFKADDNLISKTENERLEAWRFFRDCSDELTTTDSQPWISSIRAPFSSPRIPSEEISHRRDVYTKSGKRLSHPLPGWMEDFYSKHSLRSSSAACSIRYARKSAEPKERWTPIILNSATSTSGCIDCKDLARENTWKYCSHKATQIYRPRRHQSAETILKLKRADP